MDEAGITPAQEMEEVIALLEQNEDTKENAENLKTIHVQALKGETIIKYSKEDVGTLKELAIFFEACDVIKKVIKNQGEAIAVAHYKNLHWCYLELETIHARLLDNVAYN